MELVEGLKGDRSSISQNTYISVGHLYHRHGDRPVEL